jgi:hypothetical protein
MGVNANDPFGQKKQLKGLESAVRLGLPEVCWYVLLIGDVSKHY